MESEIFDYIRKKDDVSFAELSRDIPGFKGEYEISHDKHTNLIVWAGVSVEGVQAINNLLNKGLLFMRATDKLTYFIDGTHLNLPVAKNVRSYKSRRWLPIVLTYKNPEIGNK
jgi:hypothetical protein